MRFSRSNLFEALLICIGTSGVANANEATSELSDMDYVTVAADKVDPANESKLVFVQGKVIGSENFSDPDFEVSAKAIAFQRDVFDYTAPSSGSKMSHGPLLERRNEDLGSSKPFFSTKKIAPKVKLGAYNISADLLRICTRSNGDWKDIEVSNVEKLPAVKYGKLKKAPNIKITDEMANEFKSGCWAAFEENDRPSIVAIKFSFLPNPGEATIFAMQSGNNLVPTRMDLGDLKLVPLTTEEKADPNLQDKGRMFGIYLPGRRSIEELREKIKEDEQKSSLETADLISLFIMGGVAFSLFIGTSILIAALAKRSSQKQEKKKS